MTRPELLSLISSENQLTIVKLPSVVIALKINHKLHARIQESLGTKFHSTLSSSISGDPPQCTRLQANAHMMSSVAGTCKLTGPCLFYTVPALLVNVDTS